MIQSTKDISTQFAKIIVFGQPDSGKTRLCLTAPRPIIFSLENGLISLNDDDVSFLKITSYLDFQDKINWFISSDEAKDYDTLCLDSLTELSDFILNHYLTVNKTNSGAVNVQSAYGDHNKTLDKILKNFRDNFDKNLYIIAKQTFNDKLEKFIPHVNGNELKQLAPFIYDGCFLLSQGSLLTNAVGNENYYVRSRLQNLEQWETANLTDLFNKIKG